MARRLLQRLQHVAPGVGVSGATEQLRQVKMRLRRVGRIQQQQGSVSADGCLHLGKLLAGPREKLIGRGQQRVHRQVTLGVQDHRRPILRGGGQCRQPQVSVGSFAVLFGETDPDRPVRGGRTPGALGQQLFALARQAQQRGWNAEDLLRAEIRKQQRALRRKEKALDKN